MLIFIKPFPCNIIFFKTVQKVHWALEPCRSGKQAYKTAKQTLAREWGDKTKGSDSLSQITKVKRESIP